jgi:selenocysteine lyase/cysteine desulfurase
LSVEPPRLFADAPELRPRLGSRDLFGGLEPLVYLNHAGISPPSIVVKKAINAWLADYGKRGAAAYPTWAAQRLRLKDKLATLIGADGRDDIALSFNTTRGIGDVAFALPWKAGDRVIVFNGEFPANVTPWLRAAELFGLEVVMLDGALFVRDEARALEEVERALAPGAALVAVSAVQFQTGYRVPLARLSELAHARGARLFVDAVQACGATPIDVKREGVDYLACGSHKWLMGVEGAGFVYASRERARELVPRQAGWLSYENPVDFLFEGPGRLRYDKPFRSTVDVFESANVSATAFAALEASLDLILALGLDEVSKHIGLVNDAIEKGAVELGFRTLRSPSPESRSGALCLLPPDGVDVIAVHRELVRLGIACATPDGTLRFSPHWPNAVDEADQVTLSLGEALSLVRP